MPGHRRLNPMLRPEHRIRHQTAYGHIIEISVSAVRPQPHFSRGKAIIRYRYRRAPVRTVNDRIPILVPNADRNDIAGKSHFQRIVLRIGKRIITRHQCSPRAADKFIQCPRAALNDQLVVIAAVLDSPKNARAIPVTFHISGDGVVLPIGAACKNVSAARAGLLVHFVIRKPGVRFRIGLPSAAAHTPLARSVLEVVKQHMLHHSHVIEKALAIGRTQTDRAAGETGIRHLRHFRAVDIGLDVRSVEHQF